MKKSIVSAVVLVVLVVVGDVASLLAVKPMSTDLTAVGQGRPALVLADENFSPGSTDALDRLKQVRGDFEARITFLVADVGTPQGRAFADRRGLTAGQALFMQSNGALGRATFIPAVEAALRDLLERQLATLE